MGYNFAQNIFEKLCTEYIWDVNRIVCKVHSLFPHLSFCNGYVHWFLCNIPSSAQNRQEKKYAYESWGTIQKLWKSDSYQDKWPYTRKFKVIGTTIAQDRALHPYLRHSNFSPRWVASGMLHMNPWTYHRDNRRKQPAPLFFNSSSQCLCIHSYQSPHTKATAYIVSTGHSVISCSPSVPQTNGGISSRGEEEGFIGVPCHIQHTQVLKVWVSPEFLQWYQERVLQPVTGKVKVGRHVGWGGLVFACTHWCWVYVEQLFPGSH